MEVHRWHNVRADQCSLALAADEAAVRYQDGEYQVVGVYIGAGTGGRPSLCYVLREVATGDRIREATGAGTRTRSSLVRRRRDDG